jgi:hypothetical protein
MKYFFPVFFIKQLPSFLFAGSIEKFSLICRFKSAPIFEIGETRVNIKIYPKITPQFQTLIV